MKTCLGWIVVVVGVALPVIGETKPYRLPELLPPASDPKPMEFVNWHSRDPEVFVAYFEEYQASLLDYDRVRLLARAAKLYGGANAHRRFKQSGPARALIDLALKAARGAENSDTIRLRRLRVELAWGIDPGVGQREMAETQAELNAIPIGTVKILSSNDDSARPGEREALKQVIQWWADGNVYQDYPSFTEQTSTDVAPRLADLPFQDPHTKSMSAVNPKLALSYEEINRQHVSEFVGRQGFGDVSHLRIDQRQAYRDGEGNYWRVTRAELVSFLERKGLAAFQMKKVNVRFMLGIEQKANSELVPTRPLTSFEKAAFKRAIETRKPEIVESPALTKMVAPILAEASCARCHDLDVGDPLGAFSYDLEPDPSAAKEFEPRYQRRLEREKQVRAAAKKAER